LALCTCHKLFSGAFCLLRTMRTHYYTVISLINRFVLSVCHTWGSMPGKISARNGDRPAKLPSWHLLQVLTIFGSVVLSIRACLAETRVQFPARELSACLPRFWFGKDTLVSLLLHSSPRARERGGGGEGGGRARGAHGALGG
jgi:hypothetical protein